MSKLWRYEAATKTIRAVPSNHWIASMDSWDGAEDHEANARLIAAAPELIAVLKQVHAMLDQPVQYTGTDGKAAAQILRGDARIARQVIGVVLAKAAA